MSVELIEGPEPYEPAPQPGLRKLLVHLVLAPWFRLAGLTVDCRGCADTSFHTAHLRRGALTYLGGSR